MLDFCIQKDTKFFKFSILKLPFFCKYRNIVKEIKASKQSSNQAIKQARQTNCLDLCEIARNFFFVVVLGIG